MAIIYIHCPADKTDFSLDQGQDLRKLYEAESQEL